MKILIVHGIGYQEKEAEEDRRDGRKSWIEVQISKSKTRCTE